MLGLPDIDFFPSSLREDGCKRKILEISQKLILSWWDLGSAVRAQARGSVEGVKEATW
jgi:hypothetical protein